jgi:hypothetical protein
MASLYFPVISFLDTVETPLLSEDTNIALVFEIYPHSCTNQEVLEVVFCI